MQKHNLADTNLIVLNQDMY